MTFPDYEAAIQTYIDQTHPKGFRPDQLSGHEGRMVRCIADAALGDRVFVEAWINGIRYVGWATYEAIAGWKRDGLWRENNE